MVLHEDERLAARARRAYERGRLWRSFFRVWPVAPIAVVAAVVGDADTAAVLGVALALVGAALLYVGRGFDVAVETGFRAGLVPMLIALVMWEGQGCSGPAGSWCLPMCAAPSVAVGVWLGLKLGRCPSVWLGAAALLVSVMTAALGCAVLGVATFVGVAAGLSIGIAPVLVLRAAAASRR